MLYLLEGRESHQGVKASRLSGCCSILLLMQLVIDNTCSQQIGDEDRELAVNRISNLFCFEVLFNAVKYSSFGIHITRFPRFLICGIFPFLKQPFDTPLFRLSPLGSSGSLILRSESSKLLSISPTMVEEQSFIVLVRDPLKLVNPLSTDYQRDHNCSLEHVMSPEAGSRISSASCFLAGFFSVISVTLLPFSN